MYDRRLILSGGLCAALAPGAVFARATGTADLVDVRDHGAAGDGRTIDSPAINRAIAAAAARGGGTVYFPPGTYASFTIRLQSRITLHLDQGAVLLAAPVPDGMIADGYDHPEPIDPAYAAFQDFGHSHWRNSLIWGDGLHDIAIVGDGMIWGKGLTDGHPAEGYKVGDARIGVGNKSIALKNCRNVLLRDFKVLEGGWFVLLATGCDNMTIDNLLVDTNRDGFDIDCCRNVRVVNCTINSPYDDAIVGKSSYALGYPRITENLTIANCTVSGNYAIGSVIDGRFERLPPGRTMKIGRIKLGTESNGGFRNVAITNCIFDECRGLALETVDGAVLEDVAISNITMRGVTNAPLFLRLGARMRGPAGVPVGVLRRVSISNVISSGGSPLPSIIAGIPGHAVRDIRISDCSFDHAGGAEFDRGAEVPEKIAGYPETEMFGALPAACFFIRHVAGLSLDHVETTTRAPDDRAAFYLSDVDGFRASGLSLPPGRRAFVRRNVERFSL